MKKILSLLALISITFMLCFPASAETTYEDTLHDNIHGIVDVDGYADATLYFNDDGSASETPTGHSITFTITDTKYVAFSTTNLLVNELYVKGGDNYRIYTFNPAVTEAEGLCSPLNDGENIPVISHYGLLQFTIIIPTPTPTIEVTPTIETTPTPTVPATPTLPELPQTGGVDMNLMYLLGASLIASGILIKRRK